MLLPNLFISCCHEPFQGVLYHSSSCYWYALATLYEIWVFDALTHALLQGDIPGKKAAQHDLARLTVGSECSGVELLNYISMDMCALVLHRTANATLSPNTTADAV